MAVIQLQDLRKNYGKHVGIRDVTFSVGEGEIFGFVGPNGAGQSTLFKMITGFLPTDSGTCTFKGKKITGKTPDKICHMGLGRTFQAAKNFPDMSLRDNVRMGALFGIPDQTYAQAEQETDEILAYVGLDRYMGTAVPDIPLAGQKQIEVARALATKPSVLLLDEVMAGLNPAEVDEAMALVRKIRDTGVTVLLIEHVMKAVMNICDRIIVLHHGALIAEGTPAEIAGNKEVIEIYLGGEV